MATLITDRELELQLRADRAKSGGDRFDEVWEGIYMMTPLANNEHQDVAGGLSAILRAVIDWPGLGKAYPGLNVSDRDDDWTHNYRCPDVVVILNNSQAKDMGTHCLGGPDFLVEVASPDDRTWDKLPFYSQIGVRELLVVDRDPWTLELYRLVDGLLALAGRSALEMPEPLTSEVVPLSFRLLPGSPRPQIEVVHRDGLQRWVV